MKREIPYLLFGLAAVVAALIIGLSNPNLTDGGYSSSGVTCGNAFAGQASNATESGEADCAAIRSERFVWSVTLLCLGVASLAIAGVASTRIGPVSHPAT